MESDKVELERVGEDPAAGEEFEMAGWPVEEAQSFVVDLAVARVAASQCRIVPAWLRTANG